MKRTHTQHSIFIDIGSTSFRVAKNSRIIWQEPSCIAVHTKSDEMIAFGLRAYNLLGKTGDQVKVIFPYQYGVVSDSLAFEQLLTAVFRHLQLTTQGFSLLQNLFGYPGAYAYLSSISPIEKQTLAESIKRAGMGRLKATDQMQAAARSLQLSQLPEHTYCLVDIGGQVTEVALVSGGKTIRAHKIRWGGVHFTERIQEVIMQQSQCAVSWHTAELVKRQLGVISTDGKFAKHKLSVRGKNLLTQLGKTIVISNEDIAPICTTLAFELVQALQKLFAEVPTELVTSCLEQGVHVFGGGAQMQGLASFLSAQLQAEVVIPKDPDLLVLHGLMAVYS